jgi:hypothetical protein
VADDEKPDLRKEERDRRDCGKTTWAHAFEVVMIWAIVAAFLSYLAYMGQL